MAGNLLVAQSGGPTAVINASLAGVVRTALDAPYIGRVLGAVDGIRGVLDEELVDLGKENPQTFDLLPQTPGAALGTSRIRLREEHFERVLSVLKVHDIRSICFIGGNDSMDTAHKLGQLAGGSGYALQVIGVPKTVDNDLAGTDHCPGYGSAARFVAATTRDTGIDTWSGRLSTPVKIVEIMGRHAGWLTASAALAREYAPTGAPHLIYLPERPMTVKAFLADVERVYRERGYVVAALSEGVCDPAGELLGTSTACLDAFGHPQLGGVSAILAQKVADELGLKARFEKPDTMQRSSTALASPIDRQEAFTVGREAVRALGKGVTGAMITLEREAGPEYTCRTGLVDLEKVAGVERKLPAEYLSPKGPDVTAAFLDYVRPLVGEPLPAVAFLQRFAVKKRLPPWE